MQAPTALPQQQQPCSSQYGCPYVPPYSYGSAPPMMPYVPAVPVAVTKHQPVPITVPAQPIPFPPQPPAHPSVMWGPLGSSGPCGVPGIPGIHSLTPGYAGYHGFPGFLENPAMRMGRSTLHYGGNGVINSQAKAWTAHFNPTMAKLTDPYSAQLDRHSFGDSLGDRRMARINEMRDALNRVELEGKPAKTGFAAFAAY